MARVKGTKALSAYKMAKRISDRKDNVYDKRIIENILNMYMDECRKALLSGERVQITKVGTIIPEVKTRLFYNLPICNKDGGNPPYTKLRIRRNNLLGDIMNRLLIKNIENGIYGIRKVTIQYTADGYFKEKRIYNRRYKVRLREREELKYCKCME